MAAKKRASLVSIAIVVVVALVLFVGGRWYAYVAYASDPFDEVGISLNMMMPQMVRDVGCGMLKNRFEGKTLPPAGCGQSGVW